jgi:hypothetical protein
VEAPDCYPPTPLKTARDLLCCSALCRRLIDRSNDSAILNSLRQFLPRDDSQPGLAVRVVSPGIREVDWVRVASWINQKVHGTPQRTHLCRRHLLGFAMKIGSDCA